MSEVKNNKTFVNNDFESWLKKYFHQPETKIMYKSKLNNNWLSKEELERRYQKAFHPKCF